MELLRERLYPGLDKLSREQLINILLKYPCHVRGYYLKNIPVSTLHKILCGNDYSPKLACNFPIKIVTDQSIFTGKENYDSALMYAFIFLYEVELKARPTEYLGFGGSWTGFSKLQKEKAVLVPKKFLEQGSRLKDYPSHLNSDQYNDERPALQAWDNLSTISKQIINLGKEEYITEIQKLHSQAKSPIIRRSWFGF